MKKKIITKPNYVIKIFRKHLKKPFCEFDVPDEKYFDNLLNLLNSGENKFIKFGQIIFDRTDIDYVTFEEIN